MKNLLYFNFASKLKFNFLQKSGLKFITILLAGFLMMACEKDGLNNFESEVGNELLIGKWKLIKANNFSNQNAILNSTLTLNDLTYSKESTDGGSLFGVWTNNGNQSIELSMGLFNQNKNFRIITVNPTTLVLQEQSDELSQHVAYYFERMH